jgi:sugar phosphate isomerase/epimerase
MNTSRRNFLINTGILVTGTSLLSKNLFAHSGKKNELVGIQLYSIRDDMKKDPLGSLKQLAEMGYKYVEHANYVDKKFYGYSATEFRKVLDGLGIKMPSGHTVMKPEHWDAAKKDFTDSWKYTVEDAAILGQQFVISPSMSADARKNYDDLLKFMEVFNKSGELCKKSGMKFGYHNHDFEFMSSLNGKLIYDIILDNTDPNLVIQQIDVGNMYGAGGIALDILKKYPGRFESMHVKDEIKAATKGEMAGGYESTILGKGVLPVKQIVDLFREKGGTTEFIIEQESYQGKTPLECCQEDFKVMKSWGY